MSHSTTVDPFLSFWSAALGFHLVVGAVTFWLGWRWTVRLRKVRPAWLWLLQLLADAILLQFAAGVAAASAAVFAPHPFFSAARFLCQALFGEGFLLAAWVTWLHWRAQPRRRALVPGAIVVALLAVYWEAYHHGPANLQVRTHTVDLTRGRAPARTLRLLHLSDLQTHRIGPYERRALRAARNLEPDLVVFTGDYIQPRLGTDPEPARAALRDLLRELDFRPPHGFYTLPGDVEGAYWVEAFSGLPVACLEDAVALTELPGGIRLALIGLSNSTSRGKDPESLQSLLAAHRADLRIVAGHSPDFVQSLRPGVADLALAGHTHGGQVVLPGGPPIDFSRLPNRYAGGLNNYRGTPLHVSRGIGMERLTAPQIRFFCPPEICVLQIRY